MDPSATRLSSRRMLEELRRVPHIAYFSMEVALDPSIPTYSGGLGVLAGDLMRSAADLSVSIVAITLVSRRGYVRQHIADGRQVELPQPWDPASIAALVPVKVSLQVEERTVWVAAWCLPVPTNCAEGRALPVLMLDTDLPENDERDRTITDVLYGDGPDCRIKQEMVLGIGGVRLLRALRAKVQKFHMNEGHAAFLGIELLATQDGQAAAEESLAAVRKQCVFTTHTPVPAGHDRFAWELVARCLREPADEAMLRDLGGEAELNMTQLALSVSGWVNGVAARHAQVSREMFKGYLVHAITNGVHLWTWASDAHRKLYDAVAPHWCHEPEMLLHGSARMEDTPLAAAHASAKAALLARVAEALPASPLSPERLTIGFARRMTGYKRAHLVFHDLGRLRRIAKQHPLQVVFAGKAHPLDDEGKREIERLHEIAGELAGTVPVVFVPGYDMELARALVAGCDVWLNTPQPPMEASGTSGMKAAVNGVPQLSVLDGWWMQGWSEGITGWAIEGEGDDEEAQSLYDKLEYAIAPLFFGDPAGWVALMRNVIARNGALFNSHRMLRRYVLEAYSR